MLTITAWRKKLIWIAAILAVALLLFFLWISWDEHQVRETQGTPSDSLQEEVLKQPIRVQGAPARADRVLLDGGLPAPDGW
jgi:predicted negative regulator of RcsB-dependent stress response